MKIKDMFERPIDRDLQGVIMVGQDDKNNKKQELEEYVVTKELQEHFKHFFENYTKSIDTPTEKVGVWIDGFFGSGKSHFLKIISYLLENDEVLGKYAIDYFKDDNKIQDEKTILNIEKSASAPTDVVLFNIDSKSVSKNKDDDGIILKVFQRVFNELRGFYGNNQNIADLEDYLQHEGLYESFKEEFKKLNPNKRNWEETRNKYAILKGTIKDALVSSGAMSNDDAHGFIDSIDNERKLSIEDFADEVKKYLDEQGSNSRIVFLVDEVGQFIGDNVNKMLNLQTIVEELGMKCQGRAWVIVTSQQKIDKVIDVKNGKVDFSKIQGRFNTRISMSSANVDEVIKKRLLAKKPTARNILKDLYQNEGLSLENKISFQGNKKIYPKIQNEQNFVDTYPFLPYQFELLQNVLEAVRLHGSDGKHLSEGERSMLATFKESAMKYEDNDDKALIPFSAFYMGLTNFLDYNHRATILKANQDAILDDEERDFTNDVLKVLFMVKYVESFKATVENITVLMIDSIDGTLEDIKNRVKKALQKLEAQNYVLQNAEKAYEFLTDVEQDINNEIQNEIVEDNEIVRAIMSGIMNNNFIPTKYTYTELDKKYVFDINRYVDDISVGATRGNINIKLYTPLSDYYENQEMLGMSVAASDSISIELPEKDNYIENIRQSIKLEKYLKKHNKGETSSKESVIQSKKLLLKELRERLFGDGDKNNPGIVAQALNDAKIYTSTKVIDNSKKFENVLKEQIKETVRQVYRFLEYIEVPVTDKDILEIFKGTNLIPLDENDKAIEKVFKKVIVEKNSIINMSSILSTLKNRPYGYHEDEVIWILATLFIKGRVKVEYNREKLTISDAKEHPQRYFEYFTKKVYRDNLTFEARKEVNNRQMKMARDFAVDILEMSKQSVNVESTPENLMQKILKNVKNKERHLREDYLGKYLNYAGEGVIQKGIELYQEIINSEQNDNFFNHLGNVNVTQDFENWLDMMEEKGITDFYESDTKLKIWETMLKYMERYRANEVILSNSSDLVDIYEKYNDEIRLDNPAKTLPEIQKLNENFRNVFNDFVDDEYERYTKDIIKDKEKLIIRLNQANLDSKNQERLIKELDEKYSEFNINLSDSAEKGNVTKLQTERNKSNQFVDRFLNIIEETVASLYEESKAVEKQNNQVTIYENEKISEEIDSTDYKGIVPTRTISRKISEITEDETWKIENNDDIDRYLNDLKKKILKELSNADIVNIDF